MASCTLHPEARAAAPCGRCGRPFCESCLAPILGQRLCVECKQASVDTLLRPRQRHPLALLTLLVPVVGYATCVLTPITSLAGLYLGARALREMREQPEWGGRSVTLAGMVVAGGTLAAWLIATLAALWVRRG